jgi:hypothetical protein
MYHFHQIFWYRSFTAIFFTPVADTSLCYPRSVRYRIIHLTSSRRHRQNVLARPTDTAGERLSVLLSFYWVASLTAPTLEQSSDNRSVP